jgi:hypothetical protein
MEIMAVLLEDKYLLVIALPYDNHLIASNELIVAKCLIQNDILTKYFKIFNEIIAVLIREGISN